MTIHFNSEQFFGEQGENPFQQDRIRSIDIVQERHCDAAENLYYWRVNGRILQSSAEDVEIILEEGV